MPSEAELIPACAKYSFDSGAKTAPARARNHDVEARSSWLSLVALELDGIGTLTSRYG